MIIILSPSDGLAGYEEPEAERAPGLPVPHPMQGWKVEEVLQWLGTLGLDQYQESFRTNAIDGTELLTLTAADLERSLGICECSCEGFVRV